MKKFFAVLALAAAVSSESFAGGIMTNTNQSPQWIRHMARGTSLAADAVYFNPAGTAFMEDGFHFSIGNQFVFQNRRADITYAPFAMNGGNPTKRFDGKTFAPLLPNLDLVWKHKRFSVMASIGVGGGGGKAKYNDGLGVFESQFAALPAALTQLGIPTSAYSIGCKVHGYQVTYAANLGLAVRITDWLSFAAQARFNYVTNSYKGNIGNITVNPTFAPLGLDGSMVGAYDLFTKVAGAMAGTEMGAAAGQYAALVADKSLDCEQMGWGIAPVLALYFNHGGWSASVKYEFRTAITLTNKTKIDDTGLYPDGKKTPYDQPALITAALSKRFRDKVTLTAEYHYYFDKDAHFENALGTDIPKQKLINGNTMEYVFGVEWDVCKRLLLSCGVQYSDFDVRDEFHSELGFQLDALAVGIGGAVKISDKVKFNLGVCHGFYFPHTVTAVNASTGLDYISQYKRRSTTVSVGFDFKFAKKRK